MFPVLQLVPPTLSRLQHTCMLLPIGTVSFELPAPSGLKEEVWEMLDFWCCVCKEQEMKLTADKLTAHNKNEPQEADKDLPSPPCSVRMSICGDDEVNSPHLTSLDLRCSCSSLITFNPLFGSCDQNSLVPPTCIAHI